MSDLIVTGIAYLITWVGGRWLSHMIDPYLAGFLFGGFAVIASRAWRDSDKPPSQERSDGR